MCIKWSCIRHGINIFKSCPRHFCFLFKVGQTKVLSSLGSRIAYSVSGLLSSGSTQLSRCSVAWMWNIIFMSSPGGPWCGCLLHFFFLRLAEKSPCKAATPSHRIEKLVSTHLSVNFCCKNLILGAICLSEFLGCVERYIEIFW